MPRAARSGTQPLERGQRQLKVSPILVEWPAEDLLRTLEAVEHRVLVRVHTFRGTAGVAALGQPVQQRLAQAGSRAIVRRQVPELAPDEAGPALDVLARQRDGL